LQLATLLHVVAQPPPLGRVIPDALSLAFANATKNPVSAMPFTGAKMPFVPKDRAHLERCLPAS
jgi:hypothetical protein